VLCRGKERLGDGILIALACIISRHKGMGTTGPGDEPARRLWTVLGPFRCPCLLQKLGQVTVQ